MWICSYILGSGQIKAPGGEDSAKSVFASAEVCHAEGKYQQAYDLLLTLVGWTRELNCVIDLSATRLGEVETQPREVQVALESHCAMRGSLVDLLCVLRTTYPSCWW